MYQASVRKILAIFQACAETKSRVTWWKARSRFVKKKQREDEIR